MEPKPRRRGLKSRNFRVKRRLSKKLIFFEWVAWIFANKLQSSAREEYLRKQDARKLGEQRQQVGNKGNARKAGVVGKLVGGKTDLEDQILSDTSDNKGLADYGSEKNDYMKTEGSSRSQSRGKFFSYPSFILPSTVTRRNRTPL